ncbi:MAG TPA: helicase HerA-like domain-containing protein, partial [Telluria sp.]|nr:helicase HerA-like domain-containing protein [Telluria sp.]
MPKALPIAKATHTDPPVVLELLSNLVNRHGCITGATGTGKTVTLQVIAQALSDIGVPVFMADVKGDLSGMAKAGAASDKMAARLEKLGLDAPAWAG